MRNVPPIIILGPTASGKSQLAIKLAKAIEGEIVNADAMQIYKGLDVGTGKLKPERWEGVRHHLLSFVEPDQSYSAGMYRKDCLKILKEIQGRGRVPVIVGGTGFYIRTLLKGLAEIPPIPQDLRKNINRLISLYGKEYFYRFLAFLDPVYSKKISINDKQRIERALEVILYSGKPFSKFFRDEMSREDAFTNIKIGLF
ncbi:MAG: tRNA (adenosine(37)-N6)-dimethylallyltransferase MiaA, partial [Thermoanaerobaculia bacterium]